MNERKIIYLDDAINGAISIQRSNGVEIYFDEAVPVKYLQNLSFVQPEIIKCKNCKHLQKWRSEESAKKFGQIYECARNVLDCPKPEDFCSRPERRTNE